MPIPGPGPAAQARALLLCGCAWLACPAQAVEPGNATVTVTGKKEAVVRKIDRTVHDVAGAPRAANGSAQDVLQSTPELSVTADGQIAVKGNAQVTVLVNGKPTAMLSGSSEERAVALQTMSGADIASVEVITNPSAAYNANGGAIVNIVLKRNRKPGAHGQVQGSASDHGLWNAGASADLTRGGTSLHGNAALRHDGTLKIRESTVDWTQPDDSGYTRTGRTRQTSEVFVRRTVESAAFGIDHAPNDTDTVSLDARYSRRHSQPLFDVLNESRTNGAATVYHRISTGPNAQSDASASLSASRQEAATALKAVLQHSTTTGLVDKSYRDVFVVPVRPTDTSRGTTRLARRLDQATVDWTGSFARGPDGAAGTSRWGLGVDLQNKVDDIDNYQARVDPALGRETPDAATTNGYSVTSTLAAAYVTNQVREGPWEVLAGVRAERAGLRVGERGGQSLAPHAPARTFGALNPSLHLRRAAGEDASLTFNYRRSLQMPDPRDLNPFTTYIDAQHLARGNPGLHPQRLTSWEAGANAERARVGGGIALFYRTSTDTVFDAHSIEDNVLITSKRNGGAARSAGVTGNVDWTPAAALRFGMDGGVYRVRLATPDAGPAVDGVVRQRGMAGYVNFRASYRAGANDVALDAHRQSSVPTPLGRVGATSSVNLTWKRALSKTLSLTVNAGDLFDGSRRTYRTDTASFRQAGADHFVARRLTIGLVGKID